MVRYREAAEPTRSSGPRRPAGGDPGDCAGDNAGRGGQQAAKEAEEEGQAGAQTASAADRRAREETTGLRFPRGGKAARHRERKAPGYRGRKATRHRGPKAARYRGAIPAASTSDAAIAHALARRTGIRHFFTLRSATAGHGQRDRWPRERIRAYRNRRASEQRHELAPSHSITSSARASSDAGTSSPRAFAVRRLITSSYLVAACTGRSAGFSPLSMRST
jgi:hypothetical protein